MGNPLFDVSVPWEVFVSLMFYTGKRHASVLDHKWVISLCVHCTVLLLMC